MCNFYNEGKGGGEEEKGEKGLEREGRESKERGGRENESDTISNVLSQCQYLIQPVPLILLFLTSGGVLLKNILINEFWMVMGDGEIDGKAFLC